MAQRSKAKAPAQRGGAVRLWLSEHRRGFLQGGLLLIILAAGVYGLSQLKQRAEREMACAPDQMIIVIKNRPQWMSDHIVQNLANVARPTSAHSVFDHQLLVSTRKAMEADPWVAKVNEVRRAYTHSPGDTLEIDCDYRVPAAWVRWGQYYWLVDRDGYKLPEQYAADKMPGEVLSPDGHVNLRIIDGVKEPPPQAGHKWVGADLAAGLEMASVLFNRTYTEEILKIDVSNISVHADHTAPQIVLVTRYGTRVLWGRAPSDPDAFIEIRPEQKLLAMKTVYDKFGRVDMHQPWIDVRFEGVRYPAPADVPSASIEDKR